jgi:hypothetical protein
MGRDRIILAVRVRKLSGRIAGSPFVFLFPAGVYRRLPDITAYASGIEIC